MTENSSIPGSQQPSPPTWVAFLTALRFLTVLPVSYKAEHDVTLFKKAILFFPLVALLIGCLGGIAVCIAGAFLPQQLTAFALLVYCAAISGFLHIDGLADSADGLFSARPPETALKIMKDSRIGAMGVVALVLVLLGKYTALSMLSMYELAWAAVILPLAGRVAILLTMASQPYGRKEGGLGELFYSPRSRTAALSGAILLAVVCWLFGQLTAVFSITICVCITVAGFSAFCRSRLGGVTGDTLGAVCELTELTAAITICSL